MSDGYIIWHNPKCSTSRFVLEAMRDAGVEPLIRDYQKAPPSQDELREALARMQITPRDLLRRKSKFYVEMGLDDRNLSDDRLIGAMATCPELIERPVVFTPDGAALCRPKDRIFDLLPTRQEQP